MGYIGFPTPREPACRFPARRRECAAPGVVAVPELAARAGDLGTESAFEVLARAKALEAEGRQVLHLEIGEPDFPTPGHVREAAERALAEGRTRYVQAQGLPEFRQALSEEIALRRGVSIPPERVVVTAGAKAVLFYTVLLTVGPGDEVLLPDPGFPIYESVVRFAGGVPVPVPLRPEHGFRLRSQDVAERVTERTRLLILNSPGNPTGSVIPAAELARIADIAKARDLWVLSDEIYLRLTYGIPAPSFYALPGIERRTVLLDGFSKTHSMTGWRLGYAALPVELVEPFVRLTVNSVSCVPAFVQSAGLAALRGSQDHVDRMLAEFARRRDYLTAALNEIPGVVCTPPDGAFYAFPDIRGSGRPSSEVADLLLHRAGVALLPGTCFGHGGEGFLRLSYATEMKVLVEAVRRMRAVLVGA